MAGVLQRTQHPEDQDTLLEQAASLAGENLDPGTSPHDHRELSERYHRFTETYRSR